ncbi:hypothetical protein KC363_g6185 [Hortaea werneckii]|uniref:NADP-dependent oxidoreductase domain-containing protein n=1 Tax=Hortaea werneckii TaxID=91943 RepID=A0A3M7EY07_HORWE|nr:hypothetical protein KC363_g6185 [Hortaea werneckii]RMY81373.1 hypothetical protein D0861_08336 [Hortaea werneckii]
MSLPKAFPIRCHGGKTIDMPSIGYGTWASGDTSWAKDATVTALKEGYRHLDCAWFYGVDQAIGEAIRESGVPREQIFVTSKFWPNFGHPENVELCLDKILKGMGLDYLDQYLAHWPCVMQPVSRDALEKAFTSEEASPEQRGILLDQAGKPVIDWKASTNNLAQQKGTEGSFVPTWKAMQELVRKGKARSIGVSNFSVSELKELLPHEADVPISCNQIEVHPWLPNTELLDLHKKHGILTTCYSPFAGQKADGATLLKDEKVNELAKKNNMDVGQMLQSWAVQRGTVPLGKSATPSRIKSNLEIRKLSDEDMKVLDGMGLPGDESRTVNNGPDWDVPFFKN